MKKLGTAVFLGMWLLFFLGCSSTPSGTVPIGELQSKGAERVGQNVVVVGTTETKTAMSSFRMFKLFDGMKSIWVSIPESMSMPVQGMTVRISGTVQQKEFTVIGKTICIEATKLEYE